MEELEILVRYHDDYDGEPLHKLEKIEVGDWIDLYAARDVHLKSGQLCLLPLGVSMKLPEGYEAHLAPRSSAFKKWKIIMVNSVGVIDESYCGDGDIWHAPIYAIGESDIHKNDRVCQFRIMKKMPPVRLTEVEHLDSPDRGGFGSTGV